MIAFFKGVATLLGIIALAALLAGVAAFFYIAGIVGTILGVIWLFVSLACFIIRDYRAYRQDLIIKKRPYRNRP